MLTTVIISRLMFESLRETVRHENGWKQACHQPKRGWLRGELVSTLSNINFHQRTWHQSTPTSLSYRDLVTFHITVKWSIDRTGEVRGGGGRLFDGGRLFEEIRYDYRQHRWFLPHDSPHVPSSSWFASKNFITSHNISSGEILKDMTHSGFFQCDHSMTSCRSTTRPPSLGHPGVF